MKKLLYLLFSSIILLALVLTGCTNLDVVAKGAQTSFEGFANKLGAKFTFDAVNKAWVMHSPNDEHFFITIDSAIGTADVGLEFSAEPFIAAGLDVAKLPANYSYNIGENTITIIANLGNKTFSKKAVNSPQEAFAELLKAYRSSVGYHTALDHYGVDFGDGNMFEWANNLKTNDKDIVFVLNPTPFIQAGVDPTKIEGWAFLKVPVMDATGKPIQVDKILKPYDIVK
ncbi:MAG: hypothetical protein Q8N36_00715 [bacterium]|nr:hypothetical protein [bacterium]